MNAKTLFAGTSIALALTAAAATPANATITTFATVSATTADNLYLKNHSPTGNSNIFDLFTIPTAASTSPGSVGVKFSFINEGPLLDTAVTGVNAMFTLNATESGSPALAAGGYLIQNIISGSFSLVTTTPITVGTVHYLTGANLLSGVFGGASIAGPNKSTSGTLDANNENSGSTITYSSDFVTFAPGAALDSSLSLTSIVSSIVHGNAIGLASLSGSTALKTFKADAGGSFSADPVPLVNGVPEPASWALMMVGFGLAGASIRRRARVQQAAAA